MRRTYSGMMCFALGLGLSACGGGTDLDANRHQIPRNVNPTPGGGISGGPIEGVLTVFVLDYRGEAIGGATVVVDNNLERFTAVSDRRGRADFFSPLLKGPVQVHVFHRDHAFSSVLGFDASVLTLSLQPITRPAVEVSMGTVTGSVAGWDLLPPNTTHRARVAFVHPVGENLVEVEQPPRPGTVTPNNPEGSPMNLLVVGNSPYPEWRDYALDLDTRANGLVVLAGTFTNGARDPLQLTHIGVMSGLVLDGDETLSNVDLEVTHGLDQDLIANVSNAPEMPRKEALFSLRLGASGPLIPLGARTIEHGQARDLGPALHGEFAEATYAMGVRFSSESMVGDEPAAVVTAWIEGRTAQHTFKDLLQPVGRPSAAGRSIAAAPSPRATMHVYTLSDEVTGRTLWRAVVKGDDQRSLLLPQAPEGISDRLAGSLRLTVTAYDAGVLDLEEASFEALSSAVRSTATSRADVTF